MSLRKNILQATIIFLVLVVTIAANGQPGKPAVIPGDMADPSVIRVGNTYYAVGTSSEWAPHFPIYKSTDLKSWKLNGYVFDKAPAWTTGSFWAPEYYKIKDTYYIYYTARRKSDNTSYIGVATSKFPDRGFKDHGVLIAFGKEAIDAFIYNDKGQLYITFKAYGLDDRPIEILGSKLSADGLKLEGETFSLLRDDKRQGMEGQSILKKDGYYYLFYSAGNCCGTGCSYAVNVARSKNFKGPYELCDANPILSENANWKCMGHGTFVTTAQGEYYYLHHAYNKKSSVFTGREGLLSKLTWPNAGGWPIFAAQALTPASTPKSFSDEFNGKTLNLQWQWDFRHAVTVATVRNGNLNLSGSITNNNATGIALTVRPTSGNFEMTTKVVNHNNALKGLTFYGDAGAAIGIGIVANTIKVWKVEDNKTTTLAEITVKSIATDLKLVLHNGQTCSFYFKQGNGEWQKAATNVPVGFLPQWDRSPRPGLHYQGNSTDNAQFSYFRIANK